MIKGSLVISFLEFVDEKSCQNIENNFDRNIVIWNI